MINKEKKVYFALYAMEEIKKQRETVTKNFKLKKMKIIKKFA
jgi:hypothetical protein